MRNVSSLVAVGLTLVAGYVSPVRGDKPQPLVREIYVPFADLSVLLENQPQRVFLPRDQYEELLKKAKKAAEVRAPQAAMIAAADYVATIQDERAQIAGTLSIDVLEDGLHGLPLDLSGVGLRRASLDGQAASIGREADGRLTLFVQGKGRHTLVLEIVAPLETMAAQQVLTFRLPQPPAARFRLTVPGDVEVKSGAAVAGRVVDQQAGVTRFDLLPKPGDNTLVMTLNSRLQRRQRAVVARSVLVDEVTQAYERLHGTVSLAVLHQAVDRFRFVVPEGFEVTQVDSPLLARWAIEREPERRVLDVRLREQTVQTVVLNISAVRTPPTFEKWSFPKLQPLEVVGQVAVVGLLVEDRLDAQSLAAQGVIPIDSSVLQAAIPASMLRAEPGAPPLRPVVAYYVPQGDFALSGRFVRPPAEVSVITNVLLALGDRAQEVRGGFLLVPKVERLFGFDFSVPAGWQVSGVTGAQGKPLVFERFDEPGKPGRIHVRLSEGVTPGKECRVYFQAAATPAGWLGAWQSAQAAFPKFAVSGATRDQGAIAVDARDDMVVRPEKLHALTPLDEAEKARYGLGGVRTSLAYRYEGQDYEAALAVERTRPRLTARTFSFFRAESDAVVVHAEIAYQIEEARARQLSLSLPADTPAALAIVALDGVRLKEFTSQRAGERRQWNALLEEPRRGQVRLAVDFQQPAAEGKLKEFELPIVRAEGVAYQSGLVAVEGGAELDVDVSVDEAAARRVDVGELVDAAYQPWRRLLGVWGFVGDPPPVKVSVTRQPGYKLYPAIVQQAELSTALSADGVAQTAALFRLRTKALYLEMVLPEDAELWSVVVDGKPVKPQTEEGKLLVSLAAAPANRTRSLKIVYESPVLTVPVAGRVKMLAPKLFLRAEHDSEAVEVPLADLLWHLYLPTGYEVIRADGTVSGDVGRPMPAAFVAGEAALAALTFRNVLVEKLGGETLPHYLSDNVRYFAAKSASKSAAPAASVTPGRKAGGEMATPADRTELSAETLTLTRPPATAAGPGAPPVAAPASTKAPAAGESKPAEAKAAEPGYTIAKPVYEAPTKRAPYKAQLEGLSSLKIDLQTPPAGAKLVTLSSLGEEPELVVTLANRPRLEALGWALALAVALLGLARTNHRVGAKVRLIVWVMVVGTLVPLVPYGDALTLPCNMAVYAAALLVPYYLVAGVLKWAAAGLHRVRRAIRKPAATAAAVLVAVAWCGLATAADEPAAKTGPYVIQVVEPPEPVKVPEDAVILPYDPDSKTGIQDAKQILVPYAKYVELWNLAHPDKRLEVKAPPALFALAGGQYATTLQGDEYLVVEGQLEIDIFTDQFVSIPLALEGGVLARAELDGKPAQLSVAQPAPLAAKQQQSAQPAANAPASPPPAAGPLLVIQASGKGRHRLEVAVRLRLERRGGWRAVEGVLPSAPATALAIGVPQAKTEVRLSQVSDRRSYETAQPGQRIETALGLSGRIGIEWRPKVGEAQVDRSLTAQSNAVLDVQEDGLRVVWEVALEFRRGQRDSFRLVVPGDYLVEKVEGTNVRGWEIRKEEKRQVVDVSLLKTAKESERFTVRLWRAGREEASPGGREAESGLAATERHEFDCPLVSVADAALESGQVTIRRSPLLEIVTLSRSRVTRTDVDKAAAPETAGPTAADSPLGIRPYEAYQFVTMPFSIRLAATPVKGRVSAALETVLKIGAYERSLESRVKLEVRDRPIHRVEIFLPEELKLDHVWAPGDFQWTITQADHKAATAADHKAATAADHKAATAADHKAATDGRAEKRPLLTILLAAGRQGEVPVIVRGTLGGHGPVKEVPLPCLEVRGAESQTGDIAVQADPVYDITPAGLAECESVLRDQLRAWLKPEQVRATTLALHCAGPGYRGALRLALRKPDITCDTITNVRFTDRAVEETILLDFDIEQAGARQLVFLLPEWMKDSRIQVPMLRQKTIEPTATKPGAPVRVRLDLQDEVMHKLRVLVENDRLLASPSYLAPIPVIESGSARRQFVAVQSAGRDEVNVKSSRGLEPLSRQQSQWRILQEILGSGISQAWLVEAGAKEPELVLATQTRETLQTAGARIGLAETTLVFDPHGAYRAELTYHVDNSTKQALEIELPEGAELWTASVAGEPVKPAKVAQSEDRRRVRIPLVKTAPGDLDYLVVLKYGGRVASLGSLASVEFPLVKARGIEVELSHVRLYLPETHHFFQFDGTMRLAESEEDLVAGQVSYQTKTAQRLMDTLRQADAFAKVRAAANLKQLNVAAQSQSPSLRSSSNVRVQQELSQNAEVLREADRELERFERAPAQTEGLDNRVRLNELYEGQRTTRAKDVVKDLGRNFDAPVDEKAGKEVATGDKFNVAWFDKSQLAGSMPSDKAASKEKADESAKGEAGVSPRFKMKAGKDTEGILMLTNPGIAAEQAQQKAAAKQPVGVQGGTIPRSGRRGEQGRDAVQRYQEQLERGGEAAELQTQTLQMDAEKLRRDRQSAAGIVQRGRKQPPSVNFGGALAYPTPETWGMLGSGRAAQRDAQGAIQQAALPAGLASLDFEVPKRGTLYRFTTPGGDVKITARAASDKLLTGLGKAVIVLVGAWAVVLIGRMGSRGAFAWLAGPVTAALMVLLGLALLFSGFLVAGPILILLGIVLAVRRVLTLRRARGSRRGSAA
jgi:hypothetical protein